MNGKTHERWKVAERFPSSRLRRHLPSGCPLLGEGMVAEVILRIFGRFRWDKAYLNNTRDASEHEGVPKQGMDLQRINYGIESGRRGPHFG